MRTFIDTNVFLRYFDNLKSAVGFMNGVKSGEGDYYVPSVVVNEVAWTLTKLYGLKKDSIVTFVEALLAVDKFKVVYEYSIPNAIRQYKLTNIKLTDCMIWSYLDEGDRIVSYDKDFDKLPGIRRIEPKDLIG